MKAREVSRNPLLAVCLLAVLACVLATAAQALPPRYCFDKDPYHTLFGDLDQEDMEPYLYPEALPDSFGCGPTSVTNSLVYLHNQYPDIYGDLLVTPALFDMDGDDDVDYYDNEIATAVALAERMGTTEEDGTYDWDLVWGKYTYIEYKAPGRTKYWVQTKFDDWDPLVVPAWSDNCWPEWRFLWDELIACEDIEIGITYGGGGGHWLTLSSFCWEDTIEDGKIGAGEGAKIDFIDPATGDKTWSSIWQDYGRNNDWRLYLGYGGGSWIDIAVTESPVPEPSTIIVVAMGLIGLFPALRRRR